MPVWLIVPLGVLVFVLLVALLVIAAALANMAGRTSRMLDVEDPLLAQSPDERRDERGDGEREQRPDEPGRGVDPVA